MLLRHTNNKIKQANGELQAIHESPTGRHFCCHSYQIYWVITKVSDMHYLLIANFPPVKFEICSFNTI